MSAGDTLDREGRSAQVAALANRVAYDRENAKAYVDGAPHIKHASLRRLYGQLLVRVLDDAQKHRKQVRVLDLGAGEGTVTLPFLELGASVTAVDLSEAQLEALQQRCGAHGDRLEVICDDVAAVLRRLEGNFDVIVVNSFLHHIPDYLGLIDDAIPLLTDHGQFFSFQDPLLYRSIHPVANGFAKGTYYFWRLSRGDVIGGLKRYLRRKRGIFDPECRSDNAEYHVVRDGVDQDGIAELFRSRGFSCDIVRYFSTQSSIWQPVGEALGVENTFAVVARRAAPAAAVAASAAN